MSSSETLQRIVEDCLPAAAPSEHGDAEALRNAMPTVQRTVVESTRRCASHHRRPAAAGSACGCETDDAAARKFTTRWRLASAYSSACTASCCQLSGKKLAQASAALCVIHRRARTAAGSACGFGAELSRCAAKPGRVVVHRKCIVTAMARDAANVDIQ